MLHRADGEDDHVGPLQEPLHLRPGHVGQVVVDFRLGPQGVGLAKCQSWCQHDEEKSLREGTYGHPDGLVHGSSTLEFEQSGSPGTVEFTEEPSLRRSLSGESTREIIRRPILLARSPGPRDGL